MRAWALHEYHGRHQPELPPELAGLSPGDVSRVALQVHVYKRAGVILPMLAAGIKECLLVRVTPDDIPLLCVMGADSVTNYSRNKLAEPPGGDGSADWTRALRDSQEPVSGPFTAIARNTDGPMTFFDGMHRVAAWVAHVDAGRGYPLEVYLVLTEWPSPAWELPSEA